MLSKDQEIEYYKMKLEKESGTKKNNNNNGSNNKSKSKKWDFDLNYMAKGVFKYPLGHLIMFALGVVVGIIL